MGTDDTVNHLLGYAGREFESEIGLQYNQARYYDASVRKWISQDPKGFEAGDANLYRYVGNHRTYASDPSGLWRPLTAPGFGSSRMPMDSYTMFA